MAAATSPACTKPNLGLADRLGACSAYRYRGASGAQIYSVSIVCLVSASESHLSKILLLQAEIEKVHITT